MATSVPRNVTRWAAIIEATALDLGLDPERVVPLALAQIAKESMGDPGVRNEGSNTIGLGQQLAYVNAKPYRPDAAPFVHPEGTLGGYPVSWNPYDQIRALVSLTNDYRVRHSANLPAAVWTYASGPGAVRTAIKAALDPDAPKPPPHALKHKDVYLPDLAKREPAFSVWYRSWVEAGRPHRDLKNFTFATDDGPRTFEVLFAETDVPLLKAGYPSVFDGTLRFRGDSIDGPRAQTPDGVSIDGRETGETGLSLTKTLLWVGGMLLVAATGAGLYYRHRQG